ncbi:MAG: tagaturonate reductase [bacterium]
MEGRGNLIVPYPRLNRQLILDGAFQRREDIAVPKANVFDLPEKVLQFGTGGFLRAFVDFYIDHANRQGIFNGRIVAVQSTGTARKVLLVEQDGLFTLCVQGLKHNEPCEEFTIVASVSRTLAANEDWNSVLACAKNPDLEFVVSNTTEVGIARDEEDVIDFNPPRSFPGKLTACLYERFKAFSGTSDRGLVIIPCELIENNGDVLEGMVLRLAQKWALGDEFIEWIKAANVFCNSLVDRIVPGTPEEDVEKYFKKLRFEDPLLTVAESFSFWAIEAEAAVKRRLTFVEANPSVLVTTDIRPYRERKVRLLNGAHTIMVPVSFLSGNNTVLESMQHPLVSAFTKGVIKNEILPGLMSEQNSTSVFAEEVLERFRNPYLQHRLIDISIQSTSKMRTRIIPSIVRYYEQFHNLPRFLCFGYACYLLFVKSVEQKDGRFYGQRGSEPYPINDDQGLFFFQLWQQTNPNSKEAVFEFVTAVCENEPLWGVNLTNLPGFVDIVYEFLRLILREGIEQALQALIKPNTRSSAVN